MNIYAYVKNNPTNFVDPTGQYANVLIGAAIGAVAGAANAYINNNNVWAGVLTGGAAGAITGATFGAFGTVFVGATAGISGNLSEQVLNNAVNNKSLKNLNFVSAGLSGLAGGLGGAFGVYMLAAPGTATALDAAFGSGLVGSFWQMLFTLIENGVNGLLQNSNPNMCPTGKVQ